LPSKENSPKKEGGRPITLFMTREVTSKGGGGSKQELIKANLKTEGRPLEKKESERGRKTFTELKEKPFSPEKIQTTIKISYSKRPQYSGGGAKKSISEQKREKKNLQFSKITPLRRKKDPL